MPNICKYIIVWLFSHMCAFSRTYLLKSKHVWKKAPRCKYTNVFGFFQTCWVKVKHLPLLQVSILSCFGLHLFCSWVVFLSHSGCKTVKPSIKVSWSSHSLYLMIPCLKKIFLCKNDCYDSKLSLRRCLPLSFLPANVVPQILQWREKFFSSMTLHPSLKVDGGDLPMGPSSPHSLMI